MKIIWTDGYARETIADRLVAENVPEVYAGIMLEALKKHYKYDESNWFRIVPDDFRLSRGMEDLV